MSSTSLSAPSFNYKTEKIDFSKNVVLSVGASLKGNQIVKADGYVSEGINMPTTRQPLRIWNIDGEIYLFVFGGDLYKLIDGEFKLYSGNTFIEVPRLVHVKYEGKSTTLVMTSANALLCKGYSSAGVSLGDEQVALPDCDVAKYFEGVLYLAKDNTLYISKEYDFDTSSSDLTSGGRVALDSSSGKVLAIEVINNEIFVICKNKIYNIKAYGDRVDYQIKVVKTPYLDILEDSICVNEQTIYFINDKKLCYFDGSQLKQVDCLLDKGEIAISGKAYCQGDRYIVPVTVNDLEGNFAFCYSFNGEQFILNIDNIVIGEGGYGVNTQTRQLVRLQESDEQVDYLVKLIPSTFDESKIKTIVAFSVWQADRGKLKLISEYDASSYNLTRGINYRKINQKSGKLSFEFSGTSNAVNLEGLTATYY